MTRQEMAAVMNSDGPWQCRRKGLSDVWNDSPTPYLTHLAMGTHDATPPNKTPDTEASHVRNDHVESHPWEPVVRFSGEGSDWCVSRGRIHSPYTSQEPLLKDAHGSTRTFATKGDAQAAADAANAQGGAA